MDDHGLLSQYAQDRSQEAFTSLVHRYAGLVYSAALRQTHDPHEAEDTTQAVFAALAHKAHRIRPNVVLAGWLLTAVRYQTSKDKRSRLRRRHHELQAGQMVRVMDERPSQADWERIATEIDEGIAVLGQKSRDALLLRYFDGQSMAEVGATLGIGEDAARQRVCRAIEQLREFFAGRGVEVTSLGLAGLLVANAVQAAPTHVVSLATAAATSVGIAGAAAAGAAGSWIAKGAIVMTMIKAQTTVIGVIAAILAFSVTTAVVIHRARSGDQSKVVMQPATPQSDTTGINALYAFRANMVADAQGPGPSGTVVTADGKPVSDAEVLLAANQNDVDAYGTARPGSLSVRSDKDGRFAFATGMQWTDLVVRHSQGFAHVRSAAMPKDGRIVIQPWARVEGTLRVGDKPLADQQVNLSNQSMNVVPTTNPSSSTLLPAYAPSRVQYSQTTRTDENGRFLFTRVVPGTTMLGRMVPRNLQSGVQMSHIHYAMVVETASGHKVQVELGGTGRPVVGKVVLDDPSGKLTFFGSVCPGRPQPVSLVQSLANLVGMSNQERAKAAKARLNPSSVSVSRYPRTYPVDILPDGSFRADDIPAGEYQLNISNDTMDPGGGAIETLAQGSLNFTIPEIPGGRSDEPLDVGTLAVHVRPRAEIGAPAPALEAKKPDGSTLKLSDYRGKYVVLTFLEGSRGDGRSLTVSLMYPSMKIIQDRIGSSGQIAILNIILLEQDRTEGQVLGMDAAGTVAMVENWRQRLDPAYVNFPTTYLIDPEGKVLARASSSSNRLYGEIDRALGYMRWKRSGVRVLTEILPEKEVGAAFPFKTVPTISMEDAGQSAIFSIVDGNKADSAGGPSTLNDGLGPLHARDESLMFTFAPNTLESRLKADLGKVIEVSQINTFAWYKDSNRWAQVYRVYGSDGSQSGFDPEPKIGADPASCGWSLIAAVDTRATAGGTDPKNGVMGQSGVSIQGETGPIGKYRHLLFVSFATATHTAWGQTFWSEIDIVERK